MKKLFLAAALLPMMLGCTQERDVRVACVGDSITEGFGIEWQSKYGYPTRLAEVLGEGYEVMNFGRSATTMMREGDFPYWTAKEFTNALRYKPDVVVLKLGTNDCKAYQWNAAKYEASYCAMVDTLRAVNPNVRIIACLPIPVMKEKWDMKDSVIVNGVIPSVRMVAQMRNLEVIDTYSVFVGQDSLYSDFIHPTREGAMLLAETVAEAILKK